jgi:hypothetical protein
MSSKNNQRYHLAHIFLSVIWKGVDFAKKGEGGNCILFSSYDFDLNYEIKEQQLAEKYASLAL